MIKDKKYLTSKKQHSVLEKLTDKWVTAASIGEYYCILWALVKRGHAEVLFLKTSIKWRIKQ